MPELLPPISTVTSERAISTLWMRLNLSIFIAEISMRFDASEQTLEGEGAEVVNCLRRPNWLPQVSARWHAGVAPLWSGGGT